MTDPASFCGGPFQTNGFLLECREKLVLFDAPLGIVDWLKGLGKSAGLLILTHLHHDHIMDAAAAVVAFECAVWSHSDPCDELTLKSSLESMTGMSWEIGEFSVSRHLRGGEILELDGRSFEVLHIPGHSPDSLCFYDEAAKLVIGGDVLFQNSIGRTDFPNGDHEELISGIKEKLWPLPDETVVHPGHGPETNIGFEKATNPFLR